MAYFAASVDPPETNKKFAESLGLDYPILSDPDKAVARAYGVVQGDKAAASRWTFYIGKYGKVLAVDKNPTTSTAGANMVAKLEALGVPKRK